MVDGWRIAVVVEYVAEFAGIPKGTAAAAIAGICSALRVALSEGRKVTIYGLGTFKTRRRGARMVRSVHRGIPIKTKPGLKVLFKPSRLFMARVTRGQI